MSHRFQFFTRELNALMSGRLELEGKLRRALKRTQFPLHYQPRVDLATGRILGVLVHQRVTSMHRHRAWKRIKMAQLRG